jgi:hypothetical protein
MLPIPAPVPYTLPLTLRKNRRPVITFSVGILLLCIAPTLYFATITNPPRTVGEWLIFFFIAGFFVLLFLGGLSNKIRLTEDRISYREWFFTKEMEYSRITKVRFYFRDAGRGGSIPTLKLSGGAGHPIAINLSMYASPANLWILYDILKKKACRVDLEKSPDEFFTIPGETAWRKNLQPKRYTLPLTLRIDRASFITISVIFLPLIAAILSFGVVFSPPPNLATWALFILITVFFLLLYLAMSLPAIRLTEDRISCRKWFFWKVIEYTKITKVRFYYRPSWPSWDSNPILELSGDTGDTITVNFGMIISVDHIPVIYDVLKKKAGLAVLNKSPEEFFAHPGS